MHLFPCDLKGPSGQGYQTTRLLAHLADVHPSALPDGVDPASPEPGLLVTVWRWDRRARGPVPVVSAFAADVVHAGQVHTLKAPDVSPWTGEPQPAGTWTVTETGHCGCGHPFKHYPVRKLTGGASRRFAT